MGKRNSYVVSLWLKDERRAAAFDAVLSYEAAARDLSRGQALYELVRGAADVGSYPRDLRSRLEAIEGRRRDRAARAFLDALAARRTA